MTTRAWSRSTVAAGFVAVFAAAGAVGRTGGADAQEATSACTVRIFKIVFDPKRDATVRNGARLARVSFTTRWLATSGSCRRAPAPRSYRNTPLAETHRAVMLSCMAPRRIKVHVNAVVNGDSATKEPIGNTVTVGFGEPLTPLAAAVFKNKGDPLATSLYYSRRYCRVT